MQLNEYLYFLFLFFCNLSQWSIPYLEYTFFFLIKNCLFHSYINFLFNCFALFSSSFPINILVLDIVLYLCQMNILFSFYIFWKHSQEAVFLSITVIARLERRKREEGIYLSAISSAESARNVSPFYLAESEYGVDLANSGDIFTYPPNSTIAFVLFLL